MDAGQDFLRRQAAGKKERECSRRGQGALYKPGGDLLTYLVESRKPLCDLTDIISLRLQEFLSLTYKNKLGLKCLAITGYCAL